VLFGRNYLLFPTQFRCYFHKIPLFRKTAVRLQAIETAGRPRAVGSGFFRNSLLIPLLPQIATRFQCDGASGRAAAPQLFPRHAEDVAHGALLRLGRRRGRGLAGCGRPSCAPPSVHAGNRCTVVPELSAELADILLANGLQECRRQITNLKHLEGETP
jgi:hypothetical protein